MQGFVAALREHAQLIRILLFGLFVLLGLLVMFIRDGRARRMSLQLFLIYTLAVNALMVVARTEAWPFSRYPMMAVPAMDPETPTILLSFRGVDRSGREWRIDPRAWSPLFPPAIMGWAVKTFPVLKPAEREEALRFLLLRAEEARRANVTGRRFGNDVILGGLAAPDVFVYGDASQAGSSELVALRIYLVYWWYSGGQGRIRRDLIMEQRR